MIVVYCPDARLQPLVRSSLGTTFRSFAIYWKGVRVASCVASCVILVLEWLSSGSGQGGLHVLKQRPTSCPVVLVMRKDVENARALKDVVVEEVVWLEELKICLLPALEGARSRGGLDRLAAAIAGASCLPARLRTALALACEVKRPVRSVNELARLAGCHRGALWREWRNAAKPTPAFRLEVFLHCLLLYHAVVCRSAGSPWLNIARELGTHEQSLRRMAKPSVGYILAELVRESGLLPEYVHSRSMFADQPGEDATFSPPLRQNFACGAELNPLALMKAGSVATGVTRRIHHTLSRNR
ncbi:MAG: hypothetical protein H0X65_14470 [Gemmatimonadetes bacterium]|nr:hypothetical protein [Gemmatimonadota bacterium]